MRVDALLGPFRWRSGIYSLFYFILCAWEAVSLGYRNVPSSVGLPPEDLAQGVGVQP